MGLRAPVKASFDVSGFPTDVQVILIGLKMHGMIVADSGADWYVGGSPDPRRNDETLPTLDLVVGSDFEVVDTSSLAPVVVTSDAARTAGASVAVAVANVAPRVRAGGTASEVAGALLTRHRSFADPGADSWPGAADWGDGSARTALRLRADKTFTLAHRFPRVHGRSYTVVVTVRDGDGGRGSARFRVALR